MDQNIIFTNIFPHHDLEKPIPASKEIPSWYSDLNSYIGDKKIPNTDNSIPATIKKCMPVFDSMVAGYLIKSPADVFVSSKNGEKVYQWPALNLLEFHPIDQAPTHPYQKGIPYPKWNNPWSIKTPKGYSTLFMQPVHRESVFTILPGLVDTDTYFAPVNLPFVLNDVNFEGLIPKGTLIAQVIPIKRESWIMEFGEEEARFEQFKVNQRLSTVFFDKYKTMFRQVKTYK
jgi:hypothetical protein